MACVVLVQWLRSSLDCPIERCWHPSYRPPNRGFVLGANRIERNPSIDQVTVGLGGYGIWPQVLTVSTGFRH